MSGVRQGRVANGSRRKRDLAAVAPNRAAFAAEHFPGETVGIDAAIHRAFIRNGREWPPPVEDVRAIMEEKGWTLAQRKAMP